MPIYEYKCEQCGKQLEVMQKINDPAPQCEECKQPMQKVPAAAGFQLKGTGWYVTDFKK